MWREEDEALLARLTDEIVVERLFHAQVGNHASSGPAGAQRHAAGLVAAIRRAKGGAEAAREALLGNLEPIVSQLDPGKYPDGEPELLHHLALFHQRVADAKTSSADALFRSLTAWLALARDGRYLRELGEAVAATALKEADFARALEEVPLWPIDDLGKRAREGAREQAPGAAAALAVLGRVKEACQIARAPEALTRAAARRAESLRAAAVEDALAPILEGIAEASARGGPTADEGAALFAKVAAIWRWSGEDEAAELFAVEQAGPIAWHHYRSPGWADLRRLVEPLTPMVDSLARRIEADPTRIAYAAPCAQMLVFRSEIAPGIDDRIKIAERALAICPTHRNGRAVLANALCDRALRLLPGARAPGLSDYNEANSLITRAQKLFPTASRLEEAKQRLGDAKRLLRIE